MNDNRRKEIEQIVTELEPLHKKLRQITVADALSKTENRSRVMGAFMNLDGAVKNLRKEIGRA